MAVSKGRSRRARATPSREQLMRAALAVADREQAGGAHHGRRRQRAQRPWSERLLRVQAGNQGAYSDGSTAYADDVLLIADDQAVRYDLE